MKKFTSVFTLLLFTISLSQSAVDDKHDGSNHVHEDKNNSTAPAAAAHEEPSHGKPSQSDHWTYDDEAGLRIEDWAKQYPACGLKRQSPIAVNTKAVKIDPALTSLNLVDYDDSPIGDQWSAVNNGHTVQISASFRTPPQLQGAGLPGKFVFMQMHFHWGSDRNSGGEHVIDNHRFPFEVHLVHRRKNETDAEALNNEIGLAVLALEFDMAEEKDAPNPHIDSMLSMIRQVYEPGIIVNVTLPHFNLLGLCPSDQSYLRYLGSLTTPPCSEVVVWTVLTEPLKITESQLNVFRMLHAVKLNAVNSSEVRHIHMADNFRPVQDIGDRIVTFFRDRKGILSALVDSPLATTTTRRPVIVNPDNKTTPISAPASGYLNSLQAKSIKSLPKKSNASTSVESSSVGSILAMMFSVLLVIGKQ